MALVEVPDIPAVSVGAELGLTTLLAMYRKKINRGMIIRSGYVASRDPEKEVKVFPTETFASLATDPKNFSVSVRTTMKGLVLHLVVDAMGGAHGVIFECITVITSCQSNGAAPTEQPPRVRYVLGRNDGLSEFAKISDLLKVWSVEVTIKAFVLKPATPPLCLELNSARLRDDFGDGQRVVLRADGGQLPAHRLVLASTSPVFHNMLKGDFKEAKEGSVDFTGVPEKVAEKFLEFLYLGHVEDMAGLELEVLALADKYLVKELKRECEVRLWTVKPLRAVELLERAYELPAVSGELKKWFIRIIIDNWALLKNTAEWASFQQSRPSVAEVIVVCTSENSCVTSQIH